MPTSIQNYTCVHLVSFFLNFHSINVEYVQADAHIIGSANGGGPHRKR